jgi:cobalt-zinc-cadmium efflux system protein
MTTRHDHGGHPHDKTVDHSRAFLIATTLNVAFVVVEAVYGILANSLGKRDET